MYRRFLVVLTAVLLLSAIFTGCQQQTEPPVADDTKPIVTFTMQNGDVFKAELYPEIAPEAVNNFIYLANQKFYDGLTFHRIMPEFLAFGGCPKGDGTGGAGYTIRGEVPANGFDNRLMHTEGVLSTVTSYFPNSASSQFIIMDIDVTNPQHELNIYYASFGKIIEGLDKFKNVMATEITEDTDAEGNSLGIPVDPPVIESVTVDTHGQEYPEPRKFVFTTEVPDYDQELPVVTIEMADGKTIKAELYPQIAPNTVNNFISLIEQGYYDGLTFHRIMEGFMIQGGCPLGDGSGDPGYSIKEEFNNLMHTTGVLSMARSAVLDSAGSQFFIMDEDSPHLDGSYTAFGKVIAGIEHVKELAAVPLANVQYGLPVEPPVISKITVDTNGVEYPEPEKIE